MPIDPIEDIQSDAEYRRDLVRAITRRALEQAAAMSAPTKGSGTTWVGRSIRRLEDPALVQGRGHFTADLAAAHWVRFVRSPVASGRIERIKSPPNASVFTGIDLQGVKPIKPMLYKFNYVPVAQPILPHDVVRFVGEPVAAAVAPSKEEAEDLADLVEIEIAQLTPVTDGRRALSAGAPVVHAEAPSNVVVEGRVKTPNFDETLASAHTRIKFEALSRRQNATPMEARAGHAAYDMASGRITLTCTTQMPHVTRTGIADLLGMPESDLRVIAPDVGGGFGQKTALTPEYVVLVWLARHLRSSVAWTEDRRENLMAGFHSRDQVIQLEGAFDKDAKLIALSADIVANVGAYSTFPTTCGVEPLMAMAELPGPYDVRAYACVSRGVVTNTCPMAPYRGVSRPVITFALERLMDKAARSFGIDPVEIRRRNLIDRFPTPRRPASCSTRRAIARPWKWRSTRSICRRFARGRRRRARPGRFLGIGFATFSERTGYGSPAFAARGMEITPGWETVELTMDPSGLVEVRIGSSPHGQGLRTTLAQIIADEIGLEPDQIRVVHGDTDRTPYGWGTFASRSLVISGGACLIAARKMRTKLLKLASHLLEASAADIVLEARRGQGQRHRSLDPDRDDGAPRLLSDPSFQGRDRAGNDRDRQLRSGRHLFQRLPCGDRRSRHRDRPRHPREIPGGRGCRPHHQSDDRRRPGPWRHRPGHRQCAAGGDHLRRRRRHPHQHAWPTTCRRPRAKFPRSSCITWKRYSDASITKAKGVGEGGAIGAPAAILNAINDALTPFGVEIDEIPATPRKIRAALRAAMEKRA